jgi:tetratricopeptide (TPR) repeat protein
VALGVGFLLLSITATSAASAQGIQATIDRTQATLGDQLRLTLIVEGSREARPQLAAMPDFEILGQGQDTQFSMGGGRNRVEVRYNLLLAPKRTGNLTIPVATIVIGDRTYRTDPITVRITEAPSRPGDQDENREDIFVRATVSDTKPYVGEQILFTWRLYRRLQIANAQLGNFELDGFTVEELGDTRTYETVRNGQQFIVHEIRRALFPQEAGTLTIPPVELRCDVILPRDRRRRSMIDEFFARTRTDRQRLVTRPIPVEVRPLPAAPSDFSGLVGRFDLKARLSKQQLKVGESATLQVTVSGRGNVQQIGEPPLPPLPDFKIYPDKPESRFNRDGEALTGNRRFTTALVPLHPGDLTLPALKLVYFDPDAEKFQTAATPEMRLAVAPGDGEEDLGLTVALTPGGGKGAVRILADDILPIHRRLQAITAPSLQPGLPWLLGLLLPPGLYLGLRHTLRRRRLYQGNDRLARRRDALKTAQREIAALGQQLHGGGDPQQATEHASRALRGYIGDKLGVEGTALTPEETAQILASHGLEEADIQPVRHLLEAFEAAQYSATGAVPQPEELPTRLEAQIRALEQQLGKNPSLGPPPSRRGSRGSRTIKTGTGTGTGTSMALLFCLLLPLGALRATAQPPEEPATQEDPGAVNLSFPGSRTTPEDEGTEGGEGIEDLDEDEAPAMAAPKPETNTPIRRGDIDPAETFVSANAAYESGDYSRAASGFQQLLAAGHDSADLHFNLGNTYLRLGELGQAIASYRRAETRAPRDEDIAANLAFARGSTTDALEPPRPPVVLSTLFFWHYGLSRGELAMAVLVLNLLFWGLLAARLLRPASELLRWVQVAILVLLLALAASLAVRWFSPHRSAVITSLEVEARSGTGVADVVRFKLHTGTEVRLLERRPDWLRIALPDGNQGWIPADQAEVVRW